MDTNSAILRGVILGGSIGLIAGWTGMHAGRALALGILCGLLAGLTKFFMDKKKNK